MSRVPPASPMVWTAIRFSGMAILWSLLPLCSGVDCDVELEVVIDWDGVTGLATVCAAPTSKPLWDLERSELPSCELCIVILGWFENLCTSLQRPLIPGMLHRFMHFPPKTVNPRNVAQVYALPSKGFLIPEMLHRFVHFPPKTF